MYFVAVVGFVVIVAVKDVFIDVIVDDIGHSDSFDGAKSVSLKTFLLNGHSPVFKKPPLMFAGDAAF